ncbi:hypothetical protein [Phenylobacterium sp.]|nr:hypothetical protein [Phenylobacterium sp.]HVI33774.1 hypothetical protein [Phenylobacterium sp.]
MTYPYAKIPAGSGRTGMALAAERRRLVSMLRRQGLAGFADALA